MFRLGYLLSGRSRVTRVKQDSTTHAMLLKSMKSDEMVSQYKHEETKSTVQRTVMKRRSVLRDHPEVHPKPKGLTRVSLFTYVE